MAGTGAAGGGWGRRGRGVASPGEKSEMVPRPPHQTKKPVARMMDAFANDPAEPGTSLLLLSSSFSYFIFTFLDRHKSENLWVIRPLYRPLGPAYRT